MDDATARNALRLFTYGLYVATTATPDGERAAMAVNWTGQVSYEPRMLSVAVESDAHFLDVVRKSGVFAINVMESGQRELAGWFARHSAKVGDKLEGHTYTPGSTGSPL